MVEKAQKKILVAVDGTERSLKTVRYLIQVEPFKQMHMVLFNVFASVPTYFYDLEKEPASVKVVGQVRAWEAQQKKEMTDYMQKCRQILVEAGFADTGELGAQLAEQTALQTQSEAPDVFGAAISRLADGGFDRRKMTTKIAAGVYSRAGAIVEEAEKGAYGTIVVGRRGLSRVKDFFIGRVSNKVVQVGRKFTVWVVA